MREGGQVIRQPQFTERTILTPLWCKNARLLTSQHLIPVEDHTLPRPCGWRHKRITVALLIVLNLALGLAIYTVWS